MAGKIIADQIEHSTAGSLDTSYVVNGSAKAWFHFNMSAATLQDSLNAVQHYGQYDWNLNFDEPVKRIIINLHNLTQHSYASGDKCNGTTHQPTQTTYVIKSVSASNQLGK
jgi:hypothetical protein